MFEKKGCQVIAWLVMFLVAVGLLYSGTCTGLTPWSNPEGAEAGQSSIVLQIGTQTVSVKNIVDAEENARRSQDIPSGPETDFYLINTIIEETINLSAKAGLAEKRGIKITDAMIKDTLGQQFDMTLESLKMQMVQNKELKAGYTDAEFRAAFSKRYPGKTPELAKADQLASIQTELKDPVQGEGLRKSLLSAALSADYEKKSTVTLDDLKKSYEKFNLRQLTFNDAKKTAEQNEAEAKKALAEINGGLKFEAAQAKYAKGVPSAPQAWDRRTLEQATPLKDVLGFKPGQITDVVMLGSSAAIFQLVDKTATLPPDFEKNKDSMLRQLRTQESSTQMAKDVEEFKKANLVWKNESYKLGNDVFLEGQPPLSNDAKHGERMLALAKKAADLAAKNPSADPILSLARYTAFEAYYQSLTADKKKEAAAERAEVLKDVLTRNESPQLRLDLYDTLVVLEQYEEAGDALAEAAQMNSGTDAVNIKMNGELQDRANKAEKAGKVEKAAIVKVRKEIARWEKERIEEEKAKKEEPKLNSNVDKELEKLDDPEAKKKAESEKAGSNPPQQGVKK